MSSTGLKWCDAEFRHKKRPDISACCQLQPGTHSACIGLMRVSIGQSDEPEVKGISPEVGGSNSPFMLF